MVSLRVQFWGPFLFLIYINDLPLAVPNANISLYALVRPFLFLIYINDLPLAVPNANISLYALVRLAQGQYGTEEVQDQLQIDLNYASSCFIKIGLLLIQ